jgi:hypothetical protein
MLTLVPAANFICSCLVKMMLLLGWMVYLVVEGGRGIGSGRFLGTGWEGCVEWWCEVIACGQQSVGSIVPGGVC